MHRIPGLMLAWLPFTACGFRQSNTYYFRLKICCKSTFDEA